MMKIWSCHLKKRGVVVEKLRVSRMDELFNDGDRSFYILKCNKNVERSLVWRKLECCYQKERDVAVLYIWTWLKVMLLNTGVVWRSVA